MSKKVHSARIVSGGRLQISAEVRRELRLVYGDSVRMALVDGELRVRSTRDVFKRISEQIRKYVPEGVSLADELIEERRAEAVRE
jgi:hypothetical protein